MNKGDDFQKDFNADEKKDNAPDHSKELRTHDVMKADGEHGAYRPRMNHIYGKRD